MKSQLEKLWEEFEAGNYEKKKSVVHGVQLNMYIYETDGKKETVRTMCKLLDKTVRTLGATKTTSLNTLEKIAKEELAGNSAEDEGDGDEEEGGAGEGAAEEAALNESTDQVLLNESTDILRRISVEKKFTFTLPNLDGQFTFNNGTMTYGNEHYSTEVSCERADALKYVIKTFRRPLEGVVEAEIKSFCEVVDENMPHGPSSLHFHTLSQNKYGLSVDILRISLQQADHGKYRITYLWMDGLYDTVISDLETIDNVRAHIHCTLRVLRYNNIAISTFTSAAVNVLDDDELNVEEEDDGLIEWMSHPKGC